MIIFIIMRQITVNERECLVTLCIRYHECILLKVLGFPPCSKEPLPLIIIIVLLDFVFDHLIS